MGLQCTLGRGARWGFRGRDVPRGLGRCHAARKDLWVETTCESVLLESFERGVRTFLFSSDEGEVADRRGWVASCLDRSTASTLPTAEIEDLNLLFSTGDGIRTESGAHFASSCTLETPEDTTRLSQSLGASSAGDLFVVHFHSPGIRSGVVPKPGGSVARVRRAAAPPLDTLKDYGVGY